MVSPFRVRLIKNVAYVNLKHNLNWWMFFGRQVGLKKEGTFQKSSKRTCKISNQYTYLFVASRLVVLLFVDFLKVRGTSTDTVLFIMLSVGELVSVKTTSSVVPSSSSLIMVTSSQWTAFWVFREHSQNTK